VDAFSLCLETSVETRNMANCVVEVRALCTLVFVGGVEGGVVDVCLPLKSVVRQLHAVDRLEEAWRGN
jgi:hypothetical protein